MEQLTATLDKLGLEVVIGIETHIRLNTKTKLFCGCPNEEASAPNTHICSVCTGQMGVLPAINSEAIKKAILFGKAIDSSMSNELLSWDRKHYEYPDQPKNFQLTQFHNPIIPDGEVKCFRDDGSTFSVQIEQTHLEEDAAKLMHEAKNSLVDFNKSGVPLIEVVTKPCISNIKDAGTYAQYLQRIVQNLEISEANLEKGEFKSDVSVSLRKKGTQDLNPRTEIKNLNSFKFMVEATIEEVSKQLAYYEEHNSFRPDQTTVLWDEDLKQTKVMRKKEFAADYRYAHEPDIPFVNIKSALESLSVDTSLLPYAIETQLIEAGVRPQDAKFFTADAKRSFVYRTINSTRSLLNSSTNPQPDVTKFVANALTNNLLIEDYGFLSSVFHNPGSDENLVIEANIFLAFNDFRYGEINNVIFKEAIRNAIDSADNFSYSDFKKTKVVSDDSLTEAIDSVIAENTAVAEEIKAGNQGKAGVLVGKVIKIVGKGVSGKVAREKILERLSDTGSSTANTNEGEAKTEKSTKKAEVQEEELRQIPIVIKDEYRTHLVSDLSEETIGEEVTVAGWVASLRDHGDLVFIDLRDSSHQVLQVRLDGSDFDNLDEISRLKPESVIMATGKIVKRAEDDFNPGIKSGKLELDTKSLEMLNLSKTLPFELKRAARTNENTRFTYKFLDHRSDETRRAIVNRHKVLKLLRDLLDDENFLEIETPILTGGTDEGAREFIVPSRKYPGSFYTLPQAPQQFKQMLMVGGFEKYFQIARCFRDEDSRGDRQPEFTQLDIEMAFVSMQDVIDLNTKLFIEIVKRVYGNKWKMQPFQVITYADAMEKYGCDRPDLRYGLEMQTITDVVKDTTFQVFKKPIDEGGIVKCIKVAADLQGGKRMSKGQIEKLTAIAQENGLGGLAYIIVNENDLQSPIIKYLGEDIAKAIIETSGAEVGDIVFFSAADYKTANKALDAVRQELGRMLKLIDPKLLCPAWVVDFPMFEKTDEGHWTFTHNPFSMPAIKDLDLHMKNDGGEEVGEIIAQQYDIILNGYEIGGGSVRAHKPEILEATYTNMGYNHEQMLKSVGTMYKAFQYGAPPHGGIAWGIDRLMMILEKKASIREVMAFPKTGQSEDLLFHSPSPLSDKKVMEQNVKVIKKS